MKKNVIIYATCQGQAIAEILKNTPEYMLFFNEPFVIRNFVFIQSGRILINEPDYRQIFAKADVFIYQPLDDIYGLNSTGYLLPFLSPHCLKISMPYVINTSLWPFVSAPAGDLNDSWDKDAEKVVIKHIEPIDELKSKGYSNEEILSMHDHIDIDWNFSERHEIMMRYLRMKESNLDVQVTDFIEQNLAERRMFVYYSHPSSGLFTFMVNNILIILDIRSILNTYDDNAFFPSVAQLDFPVSSVDHFKLKFVGDEEKNRAKDYYKILISNYLNK
jgi:hypothetical protein